MATGRDGPVNMYEALRSAVDRGALPQYYDLEDELTDVQLNVLRALMNACFDYGRLEHLRKD